MLLIQEGLTPVLLNSLLNKRGSSIVQEATCLGEVLKMDAKFLDLFGEILMKNVRDEAIEHWDMTIQGKIMSEESQRLHNLISLSGQRELINDLVPPIVDTTLHRLLWTFEQDESIDVTHK